MLDNMAELCGLDPPAIASLARVAQGLPILADLGRADLLLLCPGRQQNTAIVVAEAKPHTVSPIHTESLVGQQIGQKTRPGIFQLFTNRALPSGLQTLVSRDLSVTCELLPVRDEQGKTIAVLSVEVNPQELKRLQRKNPVFRRALLRLRTMVLTGKLIGAESLSPITERDGPMVLDAEGRILYMSGLAENLYRKLGHNHNLIGQCIADLDTNERVFFQSIETHRCIETEVIEQGLIWIKKSIPLHAVEASWLPVPGRAARQQGYGAIVVVRDITEQRQRDQALKIKTTMIQEIHHRVKNNLQTIASLLRMQARRSHSPEVAQLLQESVSRILSVAVVHEFLSHDEGSAINIRDVCRQILSEVTQAILDPSKRITFALHGANVYLPAQQATSCALIVNELIQNAVEHGFAERDAGNIAILLDDLGPELQIEIVDDGVGLPTSFELERAPSLGLQIVRTLVRDDLRGQLEFVKANGVGVRARVIIPKPAAQLHVSEAQF